ncbi:MAG: T9SS type A sorting domain-containing protein [Candidatus Cyclobacteriaceae bacterium M3_2C_046]
MNDTIMVQLFSVSGSLLFYNTKTFSNRLEIQTNSLKPGLYFLKINNAQTVKIVVH